MNQTEAQGVLVSWVRKQGLGGTIQFHACHGRRNGRSQPYWDFELNYPKGVFHVFDDHSIRDMNGHFLSPATISNLMGVDQAWSLAREESRSGCDTRNMLEGLGFRVLEIKGRSYTVSPPPGWTMAPSRMDMMVCDERGNRRIIQKFIGAFELFRPVLTFFEERLY